MSASIPASTLQDPTHVIATLDTYWMLIMGLAEVRIISQRASVIFIKTFNFSEIHECFELTHLCEQICGNTDGSYVCSCSPGYSLATNGFSCTSKTQKIFVTGWDVIKISLPDIDECGLGTDLCTHECMDTVGSYICSCRLGYSLDTDGHTCSGMRVAHNYSETSELKTWGSAILSLVGM